MGAREKVSEALSYIESSIDSELIQENQFDQHKRYSVFDRLQGGSKR